MHTQAVVQLRFTRTSPGKPSLLAAAATGPPVPSFTSPCPGNPQRATAERPDRWIIATAVPSLQTGTS